MKAKNYKVEVSRLVRQVGTTMIEETSATRARVVAEHDAKNGPELFEWDSEVVNPTQLKSRVIED